MALGRRFKFLTTWTSSSGSLVSLTKWQLTSPRVRVSLGKESKAVAKWTRTITSEIVYSEVECHAFMKAIHNDISIRKLSGKLPMKAVIWIPLVNAKQSCYKYKASEASVGYSLRRHHSQGPALHCDPEKEYFCMFCSLGLLLASSLYQPWYKAISNFPCFNLLILLFQSFITVGLHLQGFPR